MASKEELLRAVQMASRTLAGSGHIDELLPRVLGICVDAVGASGGTIYLHEPGNHTLVFRHVLPEEVREKLEFANIPDDFGVAGEVLQTGKTQISEFNNRDDQSENRIEKQTGVQVKTMITVPLQIQGEPPIGVVQLINKSDGCFGESDITVLDTVAAVATLAILNAKLTEESARAGTLLGMGRVSHDIGNLAASLHATMAFFEFAIEGLGTTIDSKNKDVQARLDAVSESTSDFKTSIDRIVGYSHLISDLSAGRKLRPKKLLHSLSQTIQSSAQYLEPEARKNNVELQYDLQSGCPDFAHDELYIFRIVQNLVGNAIKALADTDQPASDHQKIVKLSYRFENGFHYIAVSDNGNGMSPEIASRILAGTAISNWNKQAGSGWGTKIVLELAASHNGEVLIDSTLGVGSTFTVKLPHDVDV